MAAHDRNTLITGATRGIGRACTELLSRQGHNIIGIARNRTDESFPGELLEVDLTDRRALSHALAGLTCRHTINGIVNNVGLASHQPVEDYDLDDFDAEIQINLTSTVQTVQACVPQMKQEGFGRIVNISSELVLGHFNRTGYTAAKAGLHAVVRTWSYELGPYGITVNNVAPGPVETEMFTRRNPVGSELRNAKLAKIAVGRIGEPEDIANAVAFFMSEETSWVTGQTLFVDGGSGLGGTGPL